MAEDSEDGGRKGKLHNNLPVWGNEQTMNLNPLILANIQSSSYFKVHLFKLKTFHQVVDEIYYQVKHLEPWERGSRKTAGQTGMCGGVRGVGAGGIVSTAFCLLYKLYTLRLTRKQVNGLMSHCDSPFIRALGFMYVRYTQPPGDLFDWYEEYLEDAEEVEPKAGGGQPMTVGNMCKHFLTKLEWFSTLFPRIPVPIQKQIEQRLAEHERELKITVPRTAPRIHANASTANNETERYPREQHRENFNYKNDNRDRDRTRERERERDRERFRARHRSRERERDRSRDNRDRDRDRDRERDRHRERHNRDKSRDRRYR